MENINSVIEQPKSVKTGTFVLVKYITNRQSSKLYVGQVIHPMEDKFEIKFMRKVIEFAASFAFLEKDYLDVIPLEDVILLLGDAVSVPGTKIAVGKVMFGVDLGDFAIE